MVVVAAAAAAAVVAGAVDLIEESKLIKTLKTIERVSPMKAILPTIHERLRRSFGAALLRSILIILSVVMPLAIRAADTARTFATPEEAVASLVAAVQAQDGDALRGIFGPGIAEIKNPDRVQATNEFAAFATALAGSHRLVRQSETHSVLEVGANSWPFPVPIVQRDGRWFFDTAAGTEELLNRRIGKNELEVLQVMRAYVDAQREYARRDRDGDEVLEYAQRLASSPGKLDGLYWPPDLNGETSPLGPFLADAAEEGYALDTNARSVTHKPFHGYYFKILTHQGSHAPGRKYDYIVNGNMIGGFALVAWPADYGQSGVMTFIVNQQGRVYQKDLGPKTGKTAAAMKVYDPESNWVLSPD